MRLGRRRAREGMILLNVLVIVAIAAAAVAVMIAAQDIEVQRTIRLRDASQAQAYSRAGELSAVVALRRDGVSAPTLDAYSEPCAAIAQRPIAIPNGRFAPVRDIATITVTFDFDDSYDLGFIITDIQVERAE